ncbi:hypothetical protein AT864_00883 [Anoxybacillus sp. P3H1B]|uniref:hypothetical protein n=1 Tax=Anoxybacillaceae TaxID=3120669 RepID=UPI000791D851|nr:MULTISPECIES: hypothetical protein [unclassified Anoxybacillus]KXG10292.1 hypothetical protein AT864_00883 [Anoxybacillus sp. P3H1B]
MKRKVKENAAKNNNKTPTESLPESEGIAQYASDEPMIRGANRNSKKGMQGE